jgi:hypothetical protein
LLGLVPISSLPLPNQTKIESVQESENLNADILREYRTDPELTAGTADRDGGQRHFGLGRQRRQAYYRKL